MSNPNTHDRELDQVLQRWSNQRTNDENQLTELQQRIGEALDDLRSAGLTVPVERDAADRWRIVSFMSIATSLVLLIALGWVWLGRPAGTGPIVTPHGTGDDLPPSFAWLTDQQLSAKRILLAEMENVFDRRFAWVAETGGKVQLGLDQDASFGPDENSLPLAVRIVVVRRSAEQTQWTPVWAVDLVSRSERVIQLSRSAENDAELIVWAHVLPDGMIAIDTDLEIGSQSLKHTASGRVQKNRVADRVTSQRTGDVEYQVYQTVALLDGKVG